MEAQTISEEGPSTPFITPTQHFRDIVKVCLMLLLPNCVIIMSDKDIFFICGFTHGYIPT